MEMVGVERFELPALWSQTRCATRLRYTPTLLYYPHYSYFSSLLRMQNWFYLIFVSFYIFGAGLQSDQPPVYGNSKRASGCTPILAAAPPLISRT